MLPYRRGIEPVNDPQRWPDVEGPRAVPRPAKPFVNKDGKPRTADSGEPNRADSTGEQNPDVPSGSTAVDQHPPDTEQPAGRRRSSKPASTPDVVPADASKEQ